MFKVKLNILDEGCIQLEILVVFAMAMTQRIGNDHKTPFWLVLVANHAMTRGENMLPHAQNTSDPQYFYRF